MLTPEERSFLKAHPKIILGTDKAWEPFVIIREDGSISGYDADILDLVNKRTGANFILAAGRWLEMVAKAKNKEIDGLSSGSAHKERSKYLNFSDIYASLPRMVIVLKGNPLDIRSWTDLSGKTIAIQRGNLFDEKVAGRLSESKILRVDTIDEIFTAVLQGKADVFFGQGAYMYRASKLGISTLQYAFAMDDRLDLVFSLRKDMPEALSIMNKGLRAISKDEYVRIYNKWLGSRIEERFDYTLFFEIAIPTIILMLVLSLLVWRFRKLNKRLLIIHKKLNYEITERRQVEEALRKSEETANKYLSVAGVAFVALDCNGYILLINQKGLDILGYQQDELLGKNWFEICVPEGLRNDVSNIFNLLISGTLEPVKYVESSVIRKDGTERIIAWHNTILIDTDGKIEGTLSSGEDVTDRKRSEEALEISELWLRNTFDALEEAVFVIAPERRFINLNRAAENMFGYTKEEIDEHSTAILHVNHEHYLEFGERITEAFAKGKTANFDFFAKRKNGEIFPSEHSASIIKNKSGETIGMVSVVRDISVRKKAEDALRDSENRYRSMINYSPLGIGIIDVKGVIVNANPALASMFGYEVEDLIGMNDVKKLTHPDDFIKENNFLGPLLRREITSYNLEKRYRHKDGKYYWYNVTVAKMLDPSGDDSFLLGFVEDISNRKQLEQERETLINDLQSALAEIKELRGIFPICSNCKKIRDDEGYWQQVENYITDRTNAQFSHSICPECMRDLYPDIAEKVLKKINKD